MDRNVSSFQQIQEEKLMKVNTFYVLTHRLTLGYNFNTLDKKRKEEQSVFSTDTVNKVNMTAERKHLYAPRHCG